MYSNPNGRVFVVDHERRTRTAAIRYLAIAGFNVATFPSAEAFLDQRLPAAPACVVADHCLGRFSGLDLQKRLADHISIVFMTGLSDIKTVVQAMKQGAVDFLAKPLDSKALVDAVTRGIERSIRVDAERRAREEFVMRLSRLTPREYQVILGVVRGLLNKQIAWELGTAEKTIKVHRARAMEKLEVESVAELVRIDARTQTLFRATSPQTDAVPVAARGTRTILSPHYLRSAYLAAGTRSD
jgi:FixJ family two-component response regulator